MAYVGCYVVIVFVFIVLLSAWASTATEEIEHKRLSIFVLSLVWPLVLVWMLVQVLIWIGTEIGKGLTRRKGKGDDNAS